MANKFMKKNKTNNKTDGENGQPVRIEFINATASTISIAGTFNDWRPGVTPMVSLGDGHWFKELALKPGVYEYRLVVDGQWMPDPQASSAVPNPFGGSNSLLTVSGTSNQRR
jgi:1,4-alpha-glucan branching enzyme